MKNPALSIIIPLYNAENTILRCIKSVTGQTFKDIEIIVVDDCSNDGSLSIVQNINDDRIIIIKNEKNMGTGASRNIGMEASSGSYIGFLDNDDYVDIDYFKKMTDKIIKENADVCAALRIVNHTKEKHYAHLVSPKDLREVVFIDRTAPWTKIFKKEFLIRNNIKFGTTRGEDIFPAFLSAYLANKITYIENSSYHCTIREGSISHSKIKKEDLEEIKLYKKILEYVQYSNQKKYWEKLIKKRALISVDFLYKRADENLKKEVLKIYNEIFNSKNPFVEYLLACFLINLKRINTHINYKIKQRHF